MKKIELVSPASNWPMLMASVENGADAVYLGLKEFNLRISAENFHLRELRKVVDYCHKNNVKVYLALNTLIYDQEEKKIKKILFKAKEYQVEAIICWDYLVISEALALNLNVHLSTQASVSNSSTVNFYQNLGVKRIVLARELSLKQISAIKKKNSIELECFVHGAMCLALSGRCLLSQYFFQKSANRGNCLQPCRRKYQSLDDQLEIEIGPNYILSAKDLCTIEIIDKLIKAGIDVFKIEGRSKSPEYVKVVTQCYREALDAYYQKAYHQELTDKLLKKLQTVYNRGFSKGFYLGLPNDQDLTKSEGNIASKKKKYVGRVLNYYKKVGVAEIVIEDHPLSKGNEILFVGYKTGLKNMTINSLEIDHQEVDKAKKGEKVGIFSTERVRSNDQVYLLS
ncbi:U32 family peptidase [bacterium]|nr:U32 family peptidase [bacterium]MBU1153431.1 U32 family peptidase [bacterium]MBU2599230.1 U32 family peptidase [bacterium]